ncbi:MAG: DNA polymerase III subunit gamma/tau, partial [Clostridia bacterium]|nr:DNA polymerase III subunit gamma/tau [Clostridia bacterium]
MESTSLYRKYRPQNFDEAIGQEGIVRILRNMISSGNIPHALLFTGTRGTGKTSFARIFAKAVNCLSPKNGSPCGECAACRAMANTSIDLMEIDAASNNGVDDIRALRESVVYPPADATLRYKVYIIDEVHQLTSAAFNAFLKTLEEPPAHCIFILATTEAQKLPATILSRCLRFDFRLYDQALLAEHVGKVF